MTEFFSEYNAFDGYRCGNFLMIFTTLFCSVEIMFKCVDAADPHKDNKYDR